MAHHKAKREKTVSTSEVLQLVGWLLTVIGQVQIARRDKRGFVTWVSANGVLIGLCATVGLWWSIGMYLTNACVCVWSFVRWRSEESGMRTLFVKRPFESWRAS